MELPMSASQISFSDFALAAQQAATPCTPPVIDTAVAVVAHPLAVGGGGCIRSVRSASAYRLYEVLSLRDLAPLLRDRLDYTAHLRVVASRLIGAGC